MFPVQTWLEKKTFCRTFFNKLEAAEIRKAETRKHNMKSTLRRALELWSALSES